MLKRPIYRTLCTNGLRACIQDRPNHNILIYINQQTWKPILATFVLDILQRAAIYCHAMCNISENFITFCHEHHPMECHLNWQKWKKWSQIIWWNKLEQALHQTNSYFSFVFWSSKYQKNKTWLCDNNKFLSGHLKLLLYLVCILILFLSQKLLKQRKQIVTISFIYNTFTSKGFSTIITPSMIGPVCSSLFLS